MSARAIDDTVVSVDLFDEPATEPSTLDGIPVAPALPPTFVAEVLAAEDAARPGRVHCAFTNGAARVERWLPVARGVTARPFDRVLCFLAEGSPEPIVTAIVDGLAGGLPRPAATSPRLRLQANEALCIEAADGTPLVEVRAGEGRAVITVLEHNPEIALEGSLRLSATDVHIEARKGDVKLVANGDAVVAAEIIHLN